MFCCYYFGPVEKYKTKLCNRLAYDSKYNKNDIIEYFSEFKKKFNEIINQFDVNQNYNNNNSNKYRKMLSILVFIGDIDDVELKNKFDREVAENQYVKYLFINYDIEKLKDIQEIYNKFSYKIQLTKFSTSPSMITTSTTNHGVNVCVFDLDLTIITHNGDLYYENILNDIYIYKEHFDYLILWSNGDTEYVYGFIEKYPKMKKIFNFIITRKPNESIQNNKGIAYILNYLYENNNITKLNFTCLVDDLPSNFCGDYDVFMLTSIDTDNNKERYYGKFLDTLIKIKQLYTQRGGTIPDKLRVISTK